MRRGTDGHTDGPDQYTIRLGYASREMYNDINVCVSVDINGFHKGQNYNEILKARQMLHYKTVIKGILSHAMASFINCNRLNDRLTVGLLLLALLYRRNQAVL